MSDVVLFGHVLWCPFTFVPSFLVYPLTQTRQGLTPELIAGSLMLVNNVLLVGPVVMGSILNKSFSSSGVSVGRGVKAGSLFMLSNILVWLLSGRFQLILIGVFVGTGVGVVAGPLRNYWCKFFVLIKIKQTSNSDQEDCIDIRQISNTHWPSIR